MVLIFIVLEELAAGNFLEIKIDELFQNDSIIKFGVYNYNCRYLFSLMKNKSNSKKTIQKHRENENQLISLFFSEQYYNNKIIDDIDDKIIELNEEKYYISQISLNAKSFDMALLKKESKNKYLLHLFQVTKYKDRELKNRTQYICDIKEVVKNLESIYNIKISNIYLTFVLPKNILNEDLHFFILFFLNHKLQILIFNFLTFIFIYKF